VNVKVTHDITLGLQKCQDKTCLWIKVSACNT
jgi:hypothetical protein